MKLLNPTPSEIDCAFATLIAGFRDVRMSVRWEVSNPPDDAVCLMGTHPIGRKSAIPAYSSSLESTAPFLIPFAVSIERACITGNDPKWTVGIAPLNDAKTTGWPSWIDFLGFSTDESLPRAIAIALLRAHGYEVEFP